jgi:uncharacterized membrane protein YqjE
MIETQPRLSGISDSSLNATSSGTADCTPNGTMTSLVSGILDDAQKLVRQQFDLLRTELREDFQKSKRAAQFGGLGVVVLTVGLLALVATIAYLLHDEFHLAMWASWAITSGVFLVIGTALAATSYVLMEHVVPNKSLQALQETLQWKTK